MYHLSMLLPSCYLTIQEYARHPKDTMLKLYCFEGLFVLHLLTEGLGFVNTSTSNISFAFTVRKWRPLLWLTAGAGAGRGSRGEGMPLGCAFYSVLYI